MRAETPPRPWLFSPAIDLLVGCGAWSLPLLALTFYFQRDYSESVALTFYLLALFCNQPHYMATIYRAYHTAEDFNKYRFFTVYVTVFALLTVVFAHLVPGIFPWLVTLYLSWSPWHYTGQNFGIAQMMTRRASLANATGEKPAAPADPVARHLLYFSYVASFIVWLLTLHTVRATTDPYFISLQLPERLTMPLEILGMLVSLGCAGLAFARLARHLPFRALGPALLLTCTQMLWFVVPVLFERFGFLTMPASYFNGGALAFMHCAQYLWITGYYAERENGPDAPPFSFSRYYLVLIIGGIALFIPGPWLASRVLGHDFVESFLIFTALVNLHHFILDGAIWKLRDGRIARLLLGRQAPEQEVIPPPSLTSHLGWLFGPTPPARVTRGVLAAALLALAALDQWQFFSTSHVADAAALARATAVNPYDSRPAFRRAQLALADGDFATARRELESILAFNAHNAPAQYLLGEVLLRSGDGPAALTQYDRLFVLYPGDLGVALNRGLIATIRHQPDQAIASYERAALLAPENISAHAGLAANLAQTGHADQAIEEYETVLTLCEADAQLTKGTDYLDAGLQQAGLLIAKNNLAAWQRAERRLQRTADVAARQHFFLKNQIALQRLAEVQEKLGRPADAAKNRALAARVTAPVK